MTVMQIVQQLFGSMGITMEIFFVTLITSLILGLGLALIRMSKNPILSVIAKFYISVMRGTPLMLQLLVVYFGPFFIFGMQITPSYRLKAVLIGFALNYAAYFAEIRHCSNPGWSVRGGQNAGIQQNTDICLYCDASGHQADYSAGSQ